MIAGYNSIFQEKKLCLSGYFCPTVEFVATKKEGMKRRMKFFKSDCF